VRAGLLGDPDEALFFHDERFGLTTESRVDRFFNTLLSDGTKLDGGSFKVETRVEVRNWPCAVLRFEFCGRAFRDIVRRDADASVFGVFNSALRLSGASLRFCHLSIGSHTDHFVVFEPDEIAFSAR